VIACPDMIMIGATGRNAGQTGFACALIRRLAPAVPVTAVKITVIREALEGRYRVEEEHDPGPAKDTCRMLQAGAGRVFWLRVHRDHLDEGVRALLGQIPVGTAVVCESSSGRRALEPGLFLMCRPLSGASPGKDSARDLLALADRVVGFTGRGWDLDPARCRFQAGAWSLPYPATAVILAGGQSRRMGRDKSLMPVGGQPLIARIAAQLEKPFAERLVSSNDPGKYAFLGLPVIPDQVPGQGPLMGILSSLEAAREDRILAVACDIPVLDLAFIGELMALSGTVDVVMPVSAGGRLEPLFAVYRKSAIPAARAALAEGRRRVVDVLPGLSVARPAMPAGWYCNLNTPEDVDDFGRMRLARDG